jgi:hypothetical protein
MKHVLMTLVNLVSRWLVRNISCTVLQILCNCCDIGSHWTSLANIFQPAPPWLLAYAYYFYSTRGVQAERCLQVTFNGSQWHGLTLPPNPFSLRPPCPHGTQWVYAFTNELRLMIALTELGQIYSKYQEAYINIRELARRRHWETSQTTSNEYENISRGRHDKNLSYWKI